LHRWFPNSAIEAPKRRGIMARQLQQSNPTQNRGEGRTADQGDGEEHTVGGAQEEEAEDEELDDEDDLDDDDDEEDDDEGA
jgi:hypothetical protein